MFLWNNIIQWKVFNIKSRGNLLRVLNYTLCGLQVMLYECCILYPGYITLTVHTSRRVRSGAPTRQCDNFHALHFINYYLSGLWDEWNFNSGRRYKYNHVTSIRYLFKHWIGSIHPLSTVRYWMLDVSVLNPGQVAFIWFLRWVFINNIYDTLIS